MEAQKSPPHKDKAIPSRNAGRDTILAFKLYYRARVTKQQDSDSKPEL